MLDDHAARRLTRQLDELPEILAFAYLALLPGTAPRGGRVSGATRTAPLPCQLGTLSDLAPGPTEDVPVADVLQLWARLVRADRRAANDWTAFVRLPAIHGEIPASTALKILRFHLPFAATRPYAADLAREIDELHRHLDRVARHPIKSARPVRTPCPGCQMITLCERTDGWRECLNCRNAFSPAEYDDRAGQLLAELDAAA